MRILIVLVLFILGGCTAVNQPPESIAAVTATAVTPISPATALPSPTTSRLAALVQPTVPSPTRMPIPTITAVPATAAPTLVPSPTVTPTILPELTTTTVLTLTSDFFPIDQTVDMQMVNGRIYLTRSHELLVLDPNNPGAPLGQLSFGQRFGEDTLAMLEHYHFSPLHLAVNDDGYAVVSDDQLYVVDVRDPANMVVVGQTAVRGFDMRAADGLVYLTDALNLQIVDVHNPAAPTLLADFVVYETGDFGSYLIDFELVMIGDRRLVIFAGQSRGVVMLDVTDPTNIGRLPGLPNLWVSEVTVAGNRLYVQADGQQMFEMTTDGLILVDLADVERPLLIGNPMTAFRQTKLLLPPDGRFYALAPHVQDGQNRHAVLWGTVTATGDLQLEGAAILPVGRITNEQELAVSENHLFIGGQSGVQMIDLTQLSLLAPP
jgi:hypothetical protein